MRKAFSLLALLLAFVCLQTSAQDRTITGKVTSSQDNLGIPGVTVVIAGTTTGVTTDIDGNFSITVPPTATQLRISAVGMKTKMVTLTAESKVDVIMEPDILKLDEVVVTANAITREKRSLGYATSQVKSDELTAGENTSVLGALEGKVAGVNITSLSGAAGASNRVVIRGGTSLARGNQALIIVDGVPIDNGNYRGIDPANPNGAPDDLNNQVDFGNRGNDINPNDIESVSILKGPAATALYGSRASNGAIMITTKKGKRSGGAGQAKMEVSFSSSVTFSSPLKLPDFQNQYGQGDVDNTYNDRRENFSWGLPFDGALRPWGQEIDGRQRIKPYSAIPDNEKDFFDLGVGYNNTLAFGGGSEKSAYYLSIDANNNKGIVPTTTYDKYSIHFNGSSELANHFTTGINLNYNNVSSSLPTGGQNNQSVFDQLIQTPRDIPITDGKDLNDPFNLYSDVNKTFGFYAGYTVNPYYVLANYKNLNDVDRVFGNVNITYNQWKWLTITDRLGGDIYADRRTQKWKKYDYAPIDPFYSLHQLYQGKYSEDDFNYSSLNNDLMFTFNYDLTDDIHASLLLGQNVREVKLTEVYAQTNAAGGLALPDYYNLQNSDGRPLVLNSLTRTRSVGYYADLNLSYKNFLFLGITGRNDKSSTLPTENSSYFYPGVNASFVFSELFPDNLKDKTWTYGKIRASYAKVGADATAYVTQNSFELTTIDAGFGSTVFPFGNTVGYTVSDRLGNPKIKPEFTTAFEVGTEMGFLNDRISIDFSYYQNKSTDQIIPLPLAYSSGFSSQVINTGEVRNHGIELSLRGTPIMTKSGLKIEIYGTYTKNTSLVVSLYQGVQQIVLGGSSRLAVTAQVGHPYGSFYGVDLLTHNGQVVVDSTTGMPQTTANLVYLGNYQPDYQASIGANASYKGFTLGFLFDIKQGGVFFSRTKSIMDFIGTSKGTTEHNREDYVWPNSVYQDADGNYVQNSTAFHPYDYYTNVIPEGQDMIDASYVKLRELSLTYSFPLKWLTKTPFGSASLGVFGNNLAIWTPESNQYSDPEQNSSGASNTQGFEFGSNISQRNYGVNLKVTF